MKKKKKKKNYALKRACVCEILIERVRICVSFNNYQYQLRYMKHVKL